MKICGQDYTAHSYDWYIDDAISLAARWKPGQITYQRILHLRNWIRENYQHDHNVSYQRLHSLQGCRKWVEVVIHAEYRHAPDEFKTDYQQRLSENKVIFS
ncbi:hypothetical protein [Chitinophaga sp. 212800010-3]|uniref:hypothetical protein n=1 Tax=unclassified Chitinophaga TaxID=2619133 RepID=UPI002DE7CA3C|nr:Nucleotidyltransferase AbiEii toxin of type IV toxin-antitoxin system [Chitinophaga sp. 212800010-3]